MKKTKFSLAAGYAVLAVAAIAVGVFSVYGGANLSKSLKAATIGDYGYTTNPINYTARNFFCYPGPLQPNNGTKYAGTYNTYMFSYGEAYANSGVKGTWCTNYLPSISQDPGLYDDPPLKTSTTNTPTDHAASYISSAVYKVTDANGNEDTTNTMYRRWQYHVNAAKTHENKVVFYENTLPGYGTYYSTGASPGGSTTPDAYGSGLYGNALVHCPAGAVVVDHTNTASEYKASQSSRHYGSSPTDENGLYDGGGHKWCELNGVAVQPVAGPETGKSVPDYAMTDRDKLFKFEFPDGVKKYTSYNDNSNTSSSGFVKCPDGSSAIGPFTAGNQYTNQYWVKEIGKRDYYRCYDSAKGLFTNAVADSVALASPYSSILPSYFKTDNVKNCDSTYSTCQPSCAAGDAACGGANTVGATTQPCASNTYWCQTTDVNYRYCSADATCTTTEMTPPAPTWTIAAPTNLRITGTKTTGFASTESVPVAADFAATGTGIPYGQATLTVQIAQDTSFATAWTRPSSTGSVTATGPTVNSYIDNFPATGTFYWRAKMSLGTQESVWTSTPYGSFVVCSTGKTWNGTSCVTPVVATCSLDLKLNDNKAAYNKGDMVNYTYSCSPVGTKAANVTVQVVKPDGTATTYNSGTNIDTATLGFSTSNLDAGSYTLRACLSSTCTSGVSSVNFTVEAGGTDETTAPATPVITLNGTIFKDGQYVDPATFTLRNCVSPNYWMKENTTSSGARGFHCMPNMPSYTLTSDHYPPASCTGTLWAASDTVGFSADYCAISKDVVAPVDKPVPPVTDVCIGVTTIAYDPKTNDCNQFANTCNVPGDWVFVTDGRICKEGRLTNIDVVMDGGDKSLTDLIENYGQRIREYELQLNKLPQQVQSQAQAVAVRTLVSNSAEMLKNLLQKFPTKSESDRQYIKDNLGAFSKDTFINIESGMRELAPYMDFASLKDELKRDLEKYRLELGKITDTASEYYVEFNSLIEKLDDLLNSAENQTGTALEQSLVAIKDTRNQLEALVKEQRKDQTGNFLQATINNLISDEARFNAFIEAKDLDDSKISYLFDRFSLMIEKIRAENVEAESTKKLLSLIDEAKTMRDRLLGWLEGYGLAKIEETEVTSVIEDYVDEVIAKKVEEMFGGLENSFSLMLDEALQSLVVKVAQLADKIQTLSDTVAQSVSNLQYVVERHRETIIEAKTRIIEQVESMKAALTASNLGDFTVNGMNDVMDTVAATTWCGTLAETVETNMNAAGLAIESAEFEADDLDTLKTNIEQWRVDNGEACYNGGYTPGKDVPLEAWYYGPTQFNFNRGWINGYRDIHGNLIGQFGPGNATLRIEALKMAMNLFGVERGDYSTPSDIAGVPNWTNMEGGNEAHTYVNGSLDAGVDLAKYGDLDQPITRAETAALIYDVMVASGADYFKPADTFTNVQKYNDAESVLGNKESAGIIEALTDLGIFKGSSATGNFDPYNNLARSEFATLNQRIDETFGLSDMEK